MKISIEEKSGRNFVVCVPTGIMLNHVTALFIPAMLEKEGITITRRQLMEVIRTLRDCRRANKDWKLVEVDSAKGEHIEISL